MGGNGLPPSNPVRRLLVFLPVRRVSPQGGRGHGGGWLKSVGPFLSLLHVKVQKSPPTFVSIHFGPLTFNCIYGPDCSYISFDFVQSGLSIAINEMLTFHFGPSSFNFRIRLKRLNIFGTEVSSFANFSLN